MAGFLDWLTLDQQNMQLNDAVGFANRLPEPAYPGDNLQAPFGLLAPATATRIVEGDAFRYPVDAQGNELRWIRRPGVRPFYHDPTIDKIRPSMPGFIEMAGDLTASPVGMVAATMAAGARAGRVPGLLSSGGAADEAARAAGRAGVEGGDRQLNQLGLFSRAREEAARLPQDKGTPEQMRSMLLKAGVKPDELKWTGFDDWAQGKKSVTKAEVEDFLRQNEVQVGERRLGRTGTDPLNVREMERLQELRALDGNMTDAQRSEFRALAVRNNGGERGDPTKFDQYTLPGGDNYREVLLTRPEADKSAFLAAQSRYDDLRRQTADMMADWKRVSEENSPGDPRTVEAYQRMADVRRARDQAAEEHARLKNEINAGAYRSSHWDEPNVLAHLRMKDRVDPEGRRVLHLEELQSDWAQEGRKKGFRDGRTKQAVQRDIDGALGELRERTGRYAPTDEDWAAHPDINSRFDALARELRSVPDGMSAVPSAPFVDSTDKWTALGLRRALREAAEGGYDALAWTPGREQAKRYDLSKQIDDIRYAPSADGKSVTLEAYRGGENVLNRPNVPIADLDTFVGKDVAERIAKGVGETDPNTGYRVLSGLDLRVGGEGMIGYYDKIVPAQLQKLAKGLDPNAPFGTLRAGAGGGKLSDFLGRVGMSADEWADLDDAGRQAIRAQHGTGVDLPSLTITPAMREKIKQGLPLFTMAPLLPFGLLGGSETGQ
jgi:hypothetical protein